MSDIALMLEEIRNKLDELDNKVDRLKIYPQRVWGDDSTYLEEIKAEPLKPTEVFKPIEIFPHQITEDEYKEDSRYAKLEIIYYEVDGVFVTLDDKLVEYLDEEYFGIDNLNLFGTEQASLDGKSNLYEIYLRDESIHVDYHMFYEGCISYFAEHKGE